MKIPVVLDNFSRNKPATAGDDLAGIGQFVVSGTNFYHAVDALLRLLSGIDKVSLQIKS